LADNSDSSAYHRGEVLREAAEWAQSLYRGMPGCGPKGPGPCPGAKKGGTKQPPNPHGSNGKPDHQEGVKKDAKEMQGEVGPGEEHRSQRKIQGHESNRIPDNQIVGEDGKTRKIIERERRPGSKRNQQREAEYDDLGIEHETRPVEPE
jgi:hypothetical protein